MLESILGSTRHEARAGLVWVSSQERCLVMLTNRMMGRIVVLRRILSHVNSGEGNAGVTL